MLNARGALLLIVIGTGLLTACLPGRLVYSSGTYQGTVQDIETRRPLAGAAVVAVWQEEAAIFGGHGPARDYHDVLEMVTDDQGKFEIPAKTHFTVFGKILALRLIVYSPGYAPYPALGTRPHGEALDASYVQKNFVIELPKLRTREERLQHAGRPVALDHRIPDRDTPNLLRLINQEIRELGLQPIGGEKK